jgi:hypothetical protein
VQVIGDDSEGDANRYHVGEDIIDVADTIFDEDSPTLVGDIFRCSQREHGRCVGKVYVDNPESDLQGDAGGTAIQCGWIFVKRMKYDDCNETYLMETWVTLLDRDETQRIREYHEIRR